MIGLVGGQKKDIENEDGRILDLSYETRNQNFQFNQMLIADFCYVFFSLMGLSLSILSYEI